MTESASIIKIGTLRERFPRYRCVATAHLNALRIHNLLQSPSSRKPRALRESFPGLLVWWKYTNIFPRVTDGLVRIFQPTHNKITIVSILLKIHHDLTCTAVYSSHQPDLRVSFIQIRLVDTHCVEAETVIEDF
jgi:hypothetical protein